MWEQLARIAAAAVLREVIGRVGGDTEEVIGMASTADKRRALLANIGTSGPRAKVRTAAKKLHRAFPTNGCAAFVSAGLSISGFDPVSIVGAEELADELERRGWFRVKVPDVGDVFVTSDDNGNGRADHIGFVLDLIRVKNGRLVFRCCDNRTSEFGGPYWRNVYRRPGGFTPIAYFLRPPG